MDANLHFTINERDCVLNIEYTLICTKSLANHSNYTFYKSRIPIRYLTAIQLITPVWYRMSRWNYPENI